MDPVTLDWSSAEVRHGKLSVGLRGGLPHGWKDSFRRTNTLLGGGEWGKVKLKKGRVRVHDVARGSEDRLRHYLESVVLQANEASRRAGVAEPRDPAGDGHRPDGERLDSEDRELTERFRSFAAQSTSDSAPSA
jgi:hypothetical protein